MYENIFVCYVAWFFIDVNTSGIAQLVYSNQNYHDYCIKILNLHKSISKVCYDIKYQINFVQVDTTRVLRRSSNKVIFLSF